MGSPAVDKAYECLRCARAADNDEQRVAWDRLAQLWLNLANERALMTPYEHELEAQCLRELEALAVERPDPLGRAQAPVGECTDSTVIERAIQTQLTVPVFASQRP
jgi:hypothetical protein